MHGTILAPTFNVFFRSKELEEALLQECDFGSLRNICKGRPVPEKHRANVWQVYIWVYWLCRFVFLCYAPSS
ncbi:hypothetical protein DPMN_194348 [Dreissena polymorpha]|uniref:Uncharacterized protein n=1 Tax=Dreissena polymorpha TaxID=45954 RepID=A0A9D4B7V7_DREPO|nr:hypothetical protein DPMN_194348 [Dreissena polymorpha]